jgi:hypothetical protein
MSKEEEEKIENELGTVTTPDGDLKVLKNFRLEVENREITFTFLEDETTIINVRRFEESETTPYTEEITNQVMRLSKLTIAMLMACLNKANVDFEIDADSLIAELNVKNNNERDS